MKKRSRKVILIVIFLIVIILALYLRLSRSSSIETGNNENNENIANISRDFISKFYNGNDIIKKISFHQDCNLTSSCIEITNAKTGWYGTTDEKYPISLNEYNLLKLTFKNDKDTAGISLIGNYAKSTEPWWKEKINLDFAANYKTFSVFLHTGKTEESMLLFKQDLIPDETGQLSVLILFDGTGKNFIFADAKGSFNKEIDINKESKNLFPEGIFINKSLFFGVFIAPLSQLTISEFYLMPVDQANFFPEGFIKNMTSFSFIKKFSYQQKTVFG